MKNTNFRILFSIHGILAIFIIALLVCCIIQRKMYENAVLSSTMQASHSIRRVNFIMKSGDPQKTGDAVSEIESVLSILRTFGMKDKKSASIAFDVMVMHPELVPLLSTENRGYLKEVEGKWTGQTLGYPDKW